MSDAENELKKREIMDVCPIIPDLRFASTPLHQTYLQMRVPLYLREPGCWLSAPYGSGKTTTLRYCLDTLKEEIPGQHAYLINEQVLPGNELRSFFVRALKESGHAITGLSTTDKLRNRLAQYWAELSLESPLRCVVLFLDEGQAIRESDEMLLKDLGNEIALHGGGLLTFIFGESPSFNTMISRRKMKRNGAVDRLFCGHRLLLHTYDSSKDWESLFKEMYSKKFSQLSGKSLYEAYFGHLDMSKFNISSDVTQYLRALKCINKIKGLINLRRIFVGINSAMLTCALNSVELGHTHFYGISEEQWYGGLLYAALAE